MRVARLMVSALLGCGLAVVVMQGLASASSGIQPALAAAPRQEGITEAQPVLTATIFPSKDNTLYESADGSFSNGAGPYVFVGRVGTMQTENTARRGLIAFQTFPAIPPGSTVLTVTLQMTVSRAPSTPVPQAVGLHRATADWGEGTSNGGSTGGGGVPATLNDATWVHRFYSSTVWSTLGGDFVMTASVTTTVGAVGPYTWTTSPQFVADVQGWVNAPQSNFGWVLKGDELTSFTARGFYSRETITDTRPVLIVQYTLPPYSVYLPLIQK